MSYWHGYLRFIAGEGGLKARFQTAEVGGMRVPHKLYILIPQDCEVDTLDNHYEGRPQRHGVLHPARHHQPRRGAWAYHG
jgi:hypothetical protein